MGKLVWIFVTFAILSCIVGQVQANPRGKVTSNRQKTNTKKADASAKDDSDSSEDTSKQPGICFNWEGTHYKTFDGRIFSFSSKCAHVLVRDRTDGRFSVAVEEHPKCYTEPSECSRIIRIQYGGETYTLKKSDEDQNPVFSSTKKRLSIPGKHRELAIRRAAHFTVVSLEEVGLTIKWNGKRLVEVEAEKSLWGRTEGLCGRLDGDDSNDLVDENGKSHQKVTELADSWKLEEKCADTPSDRHACPPSIHDPKSRNASNVCKALLLMNERLQTCQEAIDSFLVLDACRRDYCGCAADDPTVCVCATVAVYVRDCTFKGVKEVLEWRDENTCPMSCTGGRVYMPCGPPSGQPSCWAKGEEVGGCFEGCYCPEGTVWHENQCIKREKCPCIQNGKLHPPGSKVARECNVCTCKSGEWACTQKSCDGSCVVVGDPHYTTFDGKKYDFMGRCSYYLVKTKSFSIEGENVPCSGVNFQIGKPPSATAHLPSCLRSVTVRISGHTIHLKHERKVAVDDQTITDLPYRIAKITIRQLSSTYLQVELPNGIQIKWDGITYALFTIPSGFKEQTRGLCGTFNFNATDDFLSLEGELEATAVAFANRWKVSEECEDLPEAGDQKPCDVYPKNRAAAEKHCSTLKSKLFSPCHKVADPRQAYEDCLYDMCSCGDLPPSACLCPTLAAYADACARHGVKIDWRGKVKECAVTCPSGQFYQVCAEPCARTCRDLSMGSECKGACAEGCNCPKGQALQEGKCVPVAKCRCEFEGVFFEAGFEGLKPGDKGPEKCTCVDAVWKCRQATEEDNLPEINPSSRCKASDNLEYSKCAPVEPVTCKNMQKSAAAPCKPGCKCKNGYVLDAAAKKCVRASKCPCHHGDKTHNEDDTIKIDCNTCRCHHGKWECTNRQCPGKCSVWGDSHFKTFDGKYFDFRGQCKYTLAAGTFKKTSFEISIQNVQCETACTRSVTVLVKTERGEDTITLTRTKSLPKSAKHVTVREVGLLVVIEAANLGLVVQWDKDTRVYVMVDARWKGRTEGLCGNYNDDDADDFQKPDGTVEVSTQIFGYSWKLELGCTERNADTCDKKPDRKPWAVKRCEVLKGAPFVSCHSEIPVDLYVERCIIETSSCDQTGDCKALCTALAAYAQECNDRGVPIKWRSQKLCPMKCDGGGYSYNPCISTCPVDTCTDLAKAPVSTICRQESCTEGCAPEPCPPDQIYRNSSRSECIAFKVCKHFCMKSEGVIYREGELMEEDECHKCHCSKNGKKCDGEPCATTSIEPTSPTPFGPKCDVEEVPSEETRHLVKKRYKMHGACENDKPIPNFTRCAGSCSSSFKFNSKNKKFEGGCSCCEPLKTRDLDVELKCPNGKTVSEKVTVPTECSCSEGCK